MAGVIPPDGDKQAGKKRSGKSGKVADFRYKRSSQQNRARSTGKRGANGKRHCETSRKHARNESHDDRRKQGPDKGPDTGPDPARNGDKSPRAAKPGRSSGKPPNKPPSKPSNAFPAANPGPDARPNGGQRAPFAQPRGNEAYAALDLGTNNCRLLIARPSGSDFTVIDAFSRVVKLGEDLATTGRLSEEAMDRTVAALGVCADKLRRRNVRLARSVATEACRRAANGQAFIQRVKRETGIVLDVITAEEEARLAVLGCHILLEQRDSPAIIFDIGGGSTELVLLEASGDNGSAIPRILDWQSVPWGVVSLTDTVGECADSEAARLDRYAKMRRIVSDSFQPFTQRLGNAADQDGIRLLGTSGTVTTLASLHLELPQYDRRAVDGLIVPSQAMREISANLSGMSMEQRSELPCIGKDRADLVVAGCAILDSILDLWPAQKLGVADRGIREGILRSLMAAERESEKALDTRQQTRVAPQP